MGKQDGKTGQTPTLTPSVPHTNTSQPKGIPTLSSDVPRPPRKSAAIVIKRPDGTILDVESLKSPPSPYSTESVFDSRPASPKDEILSSPTIPHQFTASRPYSPERGHFVRTLGSRQVWVSRDTSPTPRTPGSPPHAFNEQGEETEELSGGAGEEGEEFEFNFDPPDPELELALRLSIKEEKERFAKRQEVKADPESFKVPQMTPGTPGPPRQSHQQEEKEKEKEKEKE